MTADRDEVHRLAVAEGDGAGLVEQQHVHVACCLDGPARQCNDVLLEQAVHPGDADGREERGDGGGSQADEQGHQDGERDRRPLTGGLYAVNGERAHVGADQQEDQGQRDQEHLQGDFVGGLAPLGPFDQRDHPVEEGFTRVGGDPDDNGVGDDLGAAGNGAPVPARFAHHRRRFAGHRGLVHQGGAGDYFAVARDQLARFHHNTVPLAELVCADHGEVAAEFGPCQLPGNHLGSGLPERCGARLAASFGQGLGKGGEDDGQPEPEGDKAGEPGRIGAFPGERHDEGNKGNEACDLHAKHYRVAPQGTRIELFERVDESGPHDARIEYGSGDRFMCGHDMLSVILSFRRGGPVWPPGGNHMGLPPTCSWSGVPRSVPARAPGKK